MNKLELVKEVMDKADLTKKAAEKAVQAVFSTIEEQMILGNKVQIVGHGTYEVAERAERTGRNPQTKAAIVIPAKRVPVFKPGKTFKNIVNQ